MGGVGDQPHQYHERVALRPAQDKDITPRTSFYTILYARSIQPGRERTNPLGVGAVEMEGKGKASPLPTNGF